MMPQRKTMLGIFSWETREIGRAQVRETRLPRGEITVTDQNNASIEQHDHRVHWRCPPLGGEVTFRYCRTVNDGVPCARSVECWRSVFDVKAFLERCYDPEQLAAAWGQARPDKLTQLANLVNRATERPGAGPNRRDPG